ncbi:MAG: V-type ATP synthase subunit A [Desulfuromonadales bacterium]|nr:V-type ATP synthase subunit A [Desulfuromonadales bacterium]
MKGVVTSISGATVTIDLRGLRLYDRVYIGHARLSGEVVHLEKDHTTVQVFEDTHGLSIGEPAEGTQAPLTVTLGPGLLGGVFDGLQRPLPALQQKSGAFIRNCGTIPSLDLQRSWPFTPGKEVGAVLAVGDIYGVVTEGHIEHPLFARCAGKIEHIHSGPIRLNEPLVTLQGGEQLFGFQDWSVRRPRPGGEKCPAEVPLITGQRCIDFLFPMVKGAVAIIPGGFGTGKTVLEQSIAKFTDIDVVVYVGCGERGNEMAGLLSEFDELRDAAGQPLLERTIIIANTSNMPVAARESSIFTAVTMAEYYRDMGYDVLFLADSLSRWAEALREISAALEEIPGEDGYPTYLSSRLAGFIERSGVVKTATGKLGSLSMILAVSPPGADFSEPVTQACLRAAGAFYQLDTSLAHSRHFPAINWNHSYSLFSKECTAYFSREIDVQWPTLHHRCRDILQQESALREVVEVVGMEGLQDRDQLLMSAAERIRRDFLCQNSFTADAFSSPQQTAQRIAAIIADYDQAVQRLEEGELLTDILQGGNNAPG